MNFFRKGHTFFLSLFLSFFVSLCVMVLSFFPGYQSISDTVNDFFSYKLFYSTQQSEVPIVIIRIDDATLDAVGKDDIGMTAFDKGVYAQTIQNLFEKYHASVVGVDVIFANHSVAGQEDEAKLSQVFDTYQDKIVIATRSDYNPSPLCLYSNAQQGVINMGVTGETLRSFSLEEFPYDLASKCPGENIFSGNINSISSFPVEVARMYANTIANPFEQESYKKNISLFENTNFPQAFISFFSNGKKNTGTIGYESYSFLDIYTGNAQIDLENKIVLIGEVGTLLQDSHFTPISSVKKMPGVEINANSIATLLFGKNIQKIPYFFTIVFLFFLQSALIFFVFRLRIFFAISLLIFFLFCIIFGGIELFAFDSIFNIFEGILSLVLSFFFAYIYKFQIVEKAGRKLKKQFSLYVSPDIVEEISKNPDSILVKGERRELSIFFSDIVSFTSISETVSPEKMVELLNEYFSEMTKIIHENKGTLDKYIGDAVMCFFNAPIYQENHSYFACKTALMQRKKLKELNPKWKEKGYPEIQIRIGIHTGIAVHGNIGSSDTRVNYTIIGDSVNLASRLEGVGKEYKIHICVSEDVYTLQKDYFYFRELDTISVKGKTIPVTIYELIGSKNAALPEFAEKIYSQYAAGLVQYRNENYTLAREIWEKNTSDPTSKIMSQRCSDILDGKASVLQGVFIMTHK